MAYGLRLWRRADQERLYLQGTTRRAIYLVRGSGGSILWSPNVATVMGKTCDDPDRIESDRAVVLEVFAALGLRLGEPGAYDRALDIAVKGLLVDADTAVPVDSEETV